MRLAFIISFFLILGCATTQQVVDSKQYNNQLIDVDINWENDDQVVFDVTNTSADLVYLFQVERLHIEKLKENKWVKLKILLCPCDAPCKKELEKIEISPNEKYIFKWDMLESRCGDKNEYGIRETLTEKIDKGKYRIRVLYGLNQKEKYTYYKEFEI